MMYREDVQKKFSATQLEQIWQQLIIQYGQHDSIVKVDMKPAGEHVTITVRCAYEKAFLTFQTTFDTPGKVIGFFITGVDEKAAAKELPDFLTEEEYLVRSGKYELPGILTLPQGEQTIAMVILVHGSGPNDRDETIGPNKPFRDLAWGLARNGIASVRYDKRTKVYANDIMAEYKSFTLDDETVEDAVAAVGQILADPRFPDLRIFIVGHSLGAFAAPRIAQKSGKTSGIVVMAGNTRPLYKLIREQYEYILGLDSLSEEDMKTLQRLDKQIENLLLATPCLEESEPDLPMGLPLAYWMSILEYEPVQTAKALEIPIFVMQGEEDYQVTLLDYMGWEKVLRSEDGVSFKTYPGLNHLFMMGTPGQKSRPADYQKPGEVHPAVITDLSTWIRDQITKK